MSAKRYRFYQPRQEGSACMVWIQTTTLDLWWRLCFNLCPHQAISGIDGLVRLSTFCVHKFAINEELMRHFYSHIVDVLLHLSKAQMRKTQKWTRVTIPGALVALQHSRNPPPTLLRHRLL